MRSQYPLVDVYPVMNWNPIRLVAAVMMTSVTVSTHAAVCTAESAAQRVALLELYDSEGCNSCPLIDRWMRELPSRGYISASVVTLAFHVDY